MTAIDRIRAAREKCADKSTEQFAIDCIALSMVSGIGAAE
jgi:hypothetical protein